MIAAFAIGVTSVGLLVAAWFLRARSGLRAALVVVLALAGLAVWVPSRVAAATGTTLFVQSFANNTINTTYPVSVPTSPAGTNYACLTASGNSSTGVLHSCPTANDAQGSGKLRLTAATASEEGGVFATTSVPTSQGIDATFDTYQYGGTSADGIAFVLAAVNPADPVSPTIIGQPGGSLGYSTFAANSGLADAYMGIGLDVFGNFSNSSFEGSSCTNPAYISTTGTVPGQVVVRGPGNGTTGYCAVNSTATSTSSPALTLRATSRSQSVVPVEVAINPTATSFTTASGITVAAGTYKVVFTPVRRVGHHAVRHAADRARRAVPVVLLDDVRAGYRSSSPSAGWVPPAAPPTSTRSTAVNVVSFSHGAAARGDADRLQRRLARARRPGDVHGQPERLRHGHQRDLSRVGQPDDADGRDPGRRVRVGLDLRARRPGR